MIKRIAILLSYALLGIGIVAATAIIVSFGQGYSYNLRTNSFSINGLLILSTNPSGAKVSIDGKSLRRKTPYRSTVQAGLHDVSLARDGYRTWQKRVQVLATGVTLWEDILLIPNELKPNTAVGGKHIVQVAATTDRKRFAYTTDGNDAGVWVLNAPRSQSQKVYTPVPASADKPAESVAAISWSDDGSHLLIQTKVTEVMNYSVVASGGGTVTNLTDLFKFDLSGLRFSPNDWRELYWVSPEGLRKLNVESKTVSAVLVDKVLGYTFVGNDRLAYIQSTTNGNILASSDRSGGNRKRLVEAIAESSSYQLVYSLYKSHDYIAVLPVSTQTATVYGDVFTANPASKVVSQTVKTLTASDDGRFVGFIYQDGFGAYDLDENLIYTNKLAGVGPAMGWFDDTHVLVNQNGHGVIVEYDGGNLADLQNCAGEVYGSNDQKQVLCLTPGSETEATITAVDLKK